MAPKKSPFEIALDTIDYGLCQICFKPFTERTWESRHSIWYSGEDCHAACCPSVDCRFERDARAAARKEARP